MRDFRSALLGDKSKLLLSSRRRPVRRRGQSQFLALILFLGAGTSLSLSMFGCNGGKSELHQREDEIYHGNQLVQSGQYEEAIRYFESLNAEHPSLKARMGLASAYAARAGIMVNSYWGFAVGFQKKPDLEPSNLNTTLNSLINVDETQFLGDTEKLKIQSLISSLLQLKYLVERFDNLPLINANGKKDIEKAIDVLTDLPTKGARVYRAILGAVLVKYTVVTETESWKADSDLKKASKNSANNHDRFNQCFPSYSRLINSIESIFKVLLPLKDDLSYAFPSDGNKIASSFAELEKAQDWLKEYSSQISTLENLNLCQ